MKYRYYDGLPIKRIVSRSWSEAVKSYDFFKNQGSYFIRYYINVKPGYLIYANWNGGPASGITHVGEITAVNNKNFYITQHSHNRKNEAYYRQEGRLSWWGTNPNMQNWIVIPSRKA